MDQLLLPSTLCLLALPGCAFLVFGALWLLGVEASERVLARITLAVLGLMGCAVLCMIAAVWMSGAGTVVVDAGKWFTLGHYGIPLSFLLDKVSLTMVALTVLLTGLVALFSKRYLHRDPGFFRFFLLLHLFTFGSVLLFLSSTLDLLFGGWELVGLSSVLLVGFFQFRKEPLKNAVRVFAAYRLADLQIVLATILAHQWFGGAGWEQLLKGEGAAASGMVVLLLIGACGKSAQGPFFGWLARAMEGPTPSSAVFYGAISVHAGAYLLLRVQPLIAATPMGTALVIGVGAATAMLATVAQRTRADAKTSLAYASQAQVGLILVEIGLGWNTLALVHIAGHALLRTLQFLRAPSLLHDHHQLHAAAGGHLRTADGLYARLPLACRWWLYRLSLAAGHYDALIDRYVVAPMLWLAHALGRLETGAPSLPRPRPRRASGRYAVLSAERANNPVTPPQR